MMLSLITTRHMLVVPDHFITSTIVLVTNLAENLTICNKYSTIISQDLLNFEQRATSLKRNFMITGCNVQASVRSHKITLAA